MSERCDIFELTLFFINHSDRCWYELYFSYTTLMPYLPRWIACQSTQLGRIPKLFQMIGLYSRRMSQKKIEVKTTFIRFWVSLPKNPEWTEFESIHLNHLNKDFYAIWGFCLFTVGNVGDTEWSGTGIRETNTQIELGVFLVSFVLRVRLYIRVGLI